MTRETRGVKNQKGGGLLLPSSSAVLAAGWAHNVPIVVGDTNQYHAL